MATERDYLLLSQLVYEEMGEFVGQNKKVGDIWEALKKKNGYELRVNPKGTVFAAMETEEYFNSIKT